MLVQFRNPDTDRVSRVDRDNGLIGGEIGELIKVMGWDEVAVFGIDDSFYCSICLCSPVWVWEVRGSNILSLSLTGTPCSLKQTSCIAACTQRQPNQSIDESIYRMLASIIVAITDSGGFPFNYLAEIMIVVYGVWIWVVWGFECVYLCLPLLLRSSPDFPPLHLHHHHRHCYIPLLRCCNWQSPPRLARQVDSQGVRQWDRQTGR